MSIYDSANVGPYIRFTPDFLGGGESVTVHVEYSMNGDVDWEKAWDPDAGHGHFCIPLRTWEQFQHYARSVHG